MTDLDRDIARGKQAEILLNNELLNEALETMRNEIFRAWQIAEPGDVAARERCWHAFKAAENFKSQLQRVLDGGKLAMAELKARTEKQ